MASAASARPTLAGFILLEPETPLAVLPVLQDYDTLNSEQAADEYILARHANHRMRFPMQDGPVDVTVDQYLSAHPPGDRAILADALILHMSYNTREAYEQHARAAFALSGFRYPDEDMVNDTVPMPVHGGNGGSAADVAEQEDNTTTLANIPVYNAQYTTVSQARKATYAPRDVRTIDVSGDDFKRVDEKVGTYVEKLYDAVRSVPANPSARVLRGIKRFDGRIKKIANPDRVITSISGMIVEQVLKLHAIGDHLRPDQVKDATAEDLTMRASRRLEAIVKLLRDNKLVAYDIVEGFDQIALLVAMPFATAARKKKHGDQNAGRVTTRNVKGVEGSEEAAREDQDDGAAAEQTPVSQFIEKTGSARATATRGGPGVKRKRQLDVDEHNYQEAQGKSEDRGEDYDAGSDPAKKSKGKKGKKTETDGVRRSQRKRMKKA